MDFLAEYFGDEMEDFGAVLHGVGEIANVWGYYRRLQGW
jgi:hypothetical protein